MRLSKKLAIAAVSTVAAVGIATSAFAYWTTSGSGTGSASAGTNTAVTVSQVGSISAMVPGGDAQAVDFKINNPISTPQYISSVAVSISSVTGANIDSTHPCSASDFTLVQPNAINADLSSGDHSYSPSGASLKLDDLASNQDGCKGAIVHLAFAAS